MVSSVFTVSFADLSLTKTSYLEIESVEGQFFRHKIMT